ncbi:hypothetical protein Clacol_002571 [Clathrus columnatus]|uniref:Pyridoxal phosphate homeostasis protein n=1 Tax=Clathrus columnatus TaxID=1419009 RepID=A0AAV5A151_9AGAM|nr:hypothetical protein Clacol_002571 [Clathrus columnatus]
MSAAPAISAVRGLEIKDALANVYNKIAIAKSMSSHQNLKPCLVAVSKFKPVTDIAAAYEANQKDFGENYVNEILEKAPILPADIRWHFIGHLQSNKAKTLAAIPNLYALHTLTSIKLATALNKARSPHSPLNVLLQVNTSGESSKAGLSPLTTLDYESSASSASPPSESEGLVTVARHVLTDCPNLYLMGLMTIGSLDNSLNTDVDNPDFQSLLHTRGILEEVLTREFPPLSSSHRWGNEHGRLVLSMGMSSDFEAAIRAGSGIVRVGTSIFGERQK